MGNTAGHFNVRYAVCYLFKVRHTLPLFEEACGRLAERLFGASSRPDNLADAFFYLPQLLQIALNCTLRSSSLQTIFLRLCMAPLDTTSPAAAAKRHAAHRFAALLWWLLQGCIEDANCTNHCTRLAAAVQDCVCHDGDGGALPAGTAAALCGQVDDAARALADHERPVTTQPLPPRLEASGTL